MNPKCNPVRKKGERNVFCPHYSDCLDYAVKKYWNRWNCADCFFRTNEEGRPELQVYHNETVAYYELP
jgi:hypothetical protein